MKLVIPLSVCLIAVGFLAYKVLDSRIDPQQGTPDQRSATSVGYAVSAEDEKRNETEVRKDGEKKLEKATFGNGCFWCTEALFQRLKGVEKVSSGYIGGDVDNPTYKQVCTGSTGHAEAIEIEFDPDVIAYDDLLEVFWKTHDPTTLNRQGADVGTQYRSAVFYHSEKQKETAEHYKKKLNEAKVFNKPIVTEITAATKFYPAEKYHQNYFNLNSGAGYCRVVIVPKLKKFEEAFKDKLKTDQEK